MGNEADRTRTTMSMLTNAPPQDATLANDVTAIEQALESALANGPGCPPRLMEAMRYAVLGPGKRLRPRLALLAARACGGDTSAALPAACAVEFVHAYSLVHDDLPAMDDDDLRRGRPTVHRQFDEATAILTGDALLALAFETLTTGAPSPAIVAEGCRSLATAAGPGALVGGQADDLDGADAAPTDNEGRLAHLEQIHRRKTGAMINVSLRLGALSAAANDEQLDALAAFGDALGLLFQVTDDLLDAAGDESAVGKRVGKDADRGKLTYPGLLGLEASRAYAQELATAAEQSLAPLGESAEPLRELTRQILRRDR